MLRIRYSGSTSQNWKHHLVALEGDRVSIHGTMVSDMAFEPPNVRTLYGYALPPPQRGAQAPGGFAVQTAHVTRLADSSTV
jgi:hypothetical protein